jgi:hypothetical protein
VLVSRLGQRGIQVIPHLVDDRCVGRPRSAWQGEKIMNAQTAIATETCPGGFVCPSVREDPRLSEEMEAMLVGSKCAKGIVVSFCLEAAAALAIYGLWHAWHILR